MGNYRQPGPLCRTNLLDEHLEDGTLIRARSPVPSLLPSPHLTLDPAGGPGSCPMPGDGSGLTLGVPPLKLSRFHSVGLGAAAASAATATAATTGPQTVTKLRPTAKGECAYVNPQAKGRVLVPKNVFDRLRKKNGPARISPPETITRDQLKKASEWPDAGQKEAVVQQITIASQTIRVVRPVDAQMMGKNLPTMAQLAEALRVVPGDQRDMTKTILIRPNNKGGLRGLGGEGEIEIFPVAAEEGSDEERLFRASPQTFFDNLLTHECAHNYHGKFWSGADDVADWQSYATADRIRPSPYAADSPGEDFCEFMVLYNAAVGTPCEKLLKGIYPNRWQRLMDYRAR